MHQWQLGINPRNVANGRTAIDVLVTIVLIYVIVLVVVDFLISGREIPRSILVDQSIYSLQANRKLRVYPAAYQSVSKQWRSLAACFVLEK